MTFIEGIGDEVTAFFVVLIVLILASLVTFIGHGSNLYSPVQIPVITNGIQSVSNQQAEPVQQDNNPNIRQEHIDEPEINPPQNFSNAPEINVEAVGETEEGRNEEPVNSENTNSSVPEYETIVENPQVEMIPAPGEIRIRLKYLDDTERIVLSQPATKIADFKRTHFLEDLENNKVVRLIFCGHLLRDTATLQSYRVLDNSVIHVQVLNCPRNETQRTVVTPSGDMDLSHLLWPVLSLILGICWIFYFKYPELFSMISLGILVFFTGSFMVIYNNNNINQ